VGNTQANATAGTETSLKVADIDQSRIIQRIGKDAVVKLEGAVGKMLPARIEARLLAANGSTQSSDWVALTQPAIAAGYWGGSMRVPAGGPYRLEIRSVNANGTEADRVAGKNVWGVGDIFAVLGSSTAERWFATESGCTAEPRLSVYKDGWRSSADTGIAALSFGQRYSEASGIPVGLMNYGVSGTLLRQWVEPNSPLYNAFRRAVANVGAIAGVMLHIGGNDARAGTVESQEVHEQRLRLLIGRIRRDTNQLKLPIYIMGSQRGPGSPAELEDRWTWVRAAELAVAEDPQVHFAVMNEDLRLGPDTVHLSDQSMRISAERVAATVCRAMGFIDSVVEGPKPVEAIYDENERAIFVRFDLRGAKQIGGRVSDKGITGFRASADGFSTLLRIIEANVVSVDTVRLRCEGLSPEIAVDYLAGSNPDVTNCLYGRLSLS
jgi:lysophospholipase L1-like esterase